MGQKIRKVAGTGPRGGTIYTFHCPGCGYGHPYEVPTWNWNGSLDKPTFTPSLLCNGMYPEQRCHLYMTDGKILFLSDCWHSLKGQTVEMEDDD